MSDNPPLLDLQTLSKSYDGHHFAARDISVSLREGEFLSLLGPSGSGKTTTLMMVAGFETPSSGRLLYAGRDITRETPQQRGFGMVFQNYALFPNMSVERNVAFPLTVRRLGREELAAKVDRALERVQLTALRDRYPSDLSGGQQQRVAIARALVFEPRLILMDEPLGALDRRLREDMQIELVHLQRELGLTVIYVTHDQDEAMTMSDRVAVFDRGRIAQLDSPKALYDAPASAFVAGFVGNNNRVEGIVESVAGTEGMIRLGTSGRTRATLCFDAVAGDRAQVFVRSEHVSFLEDVISAEGCDVIEGRVVELIFHGDHMRCDVDLGDGMKIAIRRSADLTPPQVGQPVQLALVPGRARAYGF
ncbi:ABC transporter ATP-binding protein [Celeribacter neptunius]|uniref:Putative spermidine/putrescine transport system ATP-binding protein n=1 Tax=Celeribacter neptunius TaxID=588602 RepID=A0A1I3TC96_9RHOB|nr:ABC transporter ATP-binding protein [Celeribacter neptunius]SFJ68009.1 putative spermidine/putrescine transport system ATP-binding protein [Celeribacter neptunius]